MRSVVVAESSLRRLLLRKGQCLRSEAERNKPVLDAKNGTTQGKGKMKRKDKYLVKMKEVVQIFVSRQAPPAMVLRQSHEISPTSGSKQQGEREAIPIGGQDACQNAPDTWSLSGIYWEGSCLGRVEGSYINTLQACRRYSGRSSTVPGLHTPSQGL